MNDYKFSLGAPRIWAVHCSPKRNKKGVRRGAPIIYVRASCPENAVLCARRNNVHRDYFVSGPARLASPQELGCVPSNLNGEINVT